MVVGGVRKAEGRRDRPVSWISLSLSGEPAAGWAAVVQASAVCVPRRRGLHGGATYRVLSNSQCALFFLFPPLSPFSPLSFRLSASLYPLPESVFPFLSHFNACPCPLLVAAVSSVLAPDLSLSPSIAYAPCRSSTWLATQLSAPLRIHGDFVNAPPSSSRSPSSPARGIHIHTLVRAP